MAMIEFEDGGVQVDAAIVAEGLKITPSLVQEQMRKGKITTLCERGIDDDQGRHRLTFFSASRRLRLLVDDNGNILQRSAVDFGDRGLPASARKPGA
jgi:hypothetical protein